MEKTADRGARGEDLQAMMTRNARLTPEAFLRAKGEKDAPAFIFLRPPCHNDEEDCFPDPGDDPHPTDPCHGQPYVWYPDLSAQIKTFAPCPTSADLRRIEQGLRSNVGRFNLADPDVRATCRDGVISIQVWGTRVDPTSCSEKARQRAPNPDLTGGGNFGLYVNSSLIKQLAARAFVVAPKILSGNGAPSPFGPVHLTSLRVDFKSPDVVETVVEGFYDGTWPDTPFTFTIVDTLGALQHVTTETRKDPHIGLGVLTELLLGAISAAFPIVIPLTALVLVGDVRALLNPPSGPGAGGVGAGILETLPTEIPLPISSGARNKLVISYGGPHVDDTGLTVAGLASSQERKPATGILGPFQLTFFAGETETFASYDAIPDDFFGDLTFAWSSSSPEVRIQSPGGSRTKVFFKRGTHPADTFFDVTLSLTVTDAEGSSASHSLSIQLFVNASDDLPPVCKNKPWLPVCQPSVAPVRKR